MFLDICTVFVHPYCICNSCIVKVTPLHALSTSDDEEIQTNIVLVWVPITLHGFYSFKCTEISFIVLILDNSFSYCIFISTKLTKIRLKVRSFNHFTLSTPVGSIFSIDLACLSIITRHAKSIFLPEAFFYLRG